MALSAAIILAAGEQAEGAARFGGQDIPESCDGLGVRA